MGNKVVFDYKDMGLAAYLIANGNKYLGYYIKYTKRFGEFNLYVKIEGNKEELIRLYKEYENNIYEINNYGFVRDIKHELSMGILAEVSGGSYE